MQLVASQNKIVIEYIRNEAGQFFRAHFLVTERAGSFFVKLIKLEAISEEAFAAKETLALPAIFAAHEYGEIKEYSIASPYFPKDFSFVTSQMTRAPSHIS